jgi:hypothetical protein
MNANDALERIWKEAVVAYFKIFAQLCGETEKGNNTLSRPIADLRAKIRTCKVKSCRTTRPGGTWGKRRYSSYSFLTPALDGGECSATRPGRDLPPGK